uniref:Uncharacterized protein n=1 Tax=Ciona intestinalis TaxID=7719 RepID=H2XYY0_CIOIN
MVETNLPICIVNGLFATRNITHANHLSVKRKEKSAKYRLWINLVVKCLSHLNQFVLYQHVISLIHVDSYVM